MKKSRVTITFTDKTSTTYLILNESCVFTVYDTYAEFRDGDILWEVHPLVNIKTISMYPAD